MKELKFYMNTLAMWIIFSGVLFSKFRIIACELLLYKIQ
jgi:hypothetical protein